MPRVEVRVEVQHAQGLAVRCFQRAQSREGEAVVSAERDDLWLREARRNGRPGAELGKRRTHLCQCLGVVHGRHGDVAAVEDLGPVLVRVHACPGVEAPERGLARRGGADCSWAEAGSWKRRARWSARVVLRRDS